MSKVLRALEEEAKDEGRVEGKKATAKKPLLEGMSIDDAKGAG